MYSSNLIKGMFFSVLTVIFLQKFFPHIISKTTYSILRGIIIFYSFLGILLLLLAYSDTAIAQRATGPYWWAYWLMTISSCGLPLILLHRKFRNSNVLLLVISVVINLGWLFEIIVIFTTSLHRDYATEGYKNILFPTVLIFVAMQGIFVGLLTVLIENIIRVYYRKLTLLNL